MIYFLSFIVIVCFLLGVSLIFQGYTRMSDKPVGIDPEIAKKNEADLKNVRDTAEQYRQQMEAMAIELKDVKGKLEWAQENVKALEEEQKEIPKAKEELNTMQNDLNFLTIKADNLARESIAVIQRLEEEKAQLQFTVEQNQSKVSQEEFDKLKDENQKFKIQIDGFVNKVKELEAALATQSKAAEALNQLKQDQQKAVEEMEALKKASLEYDEKLKSAESIQAQAKTTQDQLEQEILNLNQKISDLTQENLDLKAQPTTNPSAISEEEFVKIRQESEEKLNQANGALTKLYQEIEVLNEQSKEKDARLKQLSEELLAARHTARESDESVAARTELEQRLGELQKSVQLMTDKEKILTMKLIQARAKLTGMALIGADQAKVAG